VCWAQALSNTVWAFSKLDVVKPELLNALAVEMQRRIHQFNSQNLANTVRLLSVSCHQGGAACPAGTPSV
jgi:hypothetical protein